MEPWNHSKRRIETLLVLLAVLHQLIGSIHQPAAAGRCALGTVHTPRIYRHGKPSHYLRLLALGAHSSWGDEAGLPWLSARRIRAIVDDVVDQVHAVRRGDFSGESKGALASAIHGLGLLVVTAIAATGTVYFFATPSIAHNALALHRLFANLMWAYILGPAGIAVLHHLLGSDILRRIFWIRRGVPFTAGWPRNTPMSSDTLVETDRR
jgi:hypothetical protein